MDDGWGFNLYDKDGIACIDKPGVGAMGIHYVNGPLVPDGAVDATTPEALIYEPQKNGRLRLVAVVLQDAWDAAHSTPPSLFGEEFKLVPGPGGSLLRDAVSAPPKLPAAAKAQAGAAVVVGARGQPDGPAQPAHRRPVLDAELLEPRNPRPCAPPRLSERNSTWAAPSARVRSSTCPPDAPRGRSVAFAFIDRGVPAGEAVVLEAAQLEALLAKTFDLGLNVGRGWQ